jgi:cell division septation protein DedD
MIPKMMKAAVYLGTEHIEIHEIPVPEVDDDSALVKVHACAVCGSEIENVRGAHSDKNEDKACDTCGYMMDGSATEETEATDTTETTDQTTTGETGTQTDPTEGNKQENGSNEAPPANEPEKQNKKSDKSYILLIVAGVCGAGAVFVYFGWPKLKKYFKK